ncbi:MAG: peptidoglycan-associated lipoprotein [Limisphaerales bacterium]|nr:MAG: peptidoglycan-associated lipoprotein [Limisphaerales bacterium]KAG0509329.1 MAG: peptidoglycan-associated lipoprotein [Limisphaerales bacterium]TXT52074.1 MAG: peptidoglycan-associated lipoprotein [Limisphaerales bacterium]
MKHAIFLKLAAVALLTIIAATGCKKTPKNVTPIHGARTSVDGGAKPTGPTTAAPELGAGLTGLPPARLIEAAPVATGLPPGVIPGLTPQGGIPAADQGEFDNHWTDRSAFAANTIHFDYDKAIVKAGELGKLQPVIAALKASPQNKLLIEGHCDERGTEEYNRALGERRALAIRERLAKSGISPDRLRTMSYGEDKPAELGHTESAWAKNRRGELVLLKPKN